MINRAPWIFFSFFLARLIHLCAFLFRRGIRHPSGACCVTTTEEAQYRVSTFTCWSACHSWVINQNVVNSPKSGTWEFENQWLVMFCGHAICAGLCAQELSPAALVVCMCVSESLWQRTGINIDCSVFLCVFTYESCGLGLCQRGPPPAVRQAEALALVCAGLVSPVSEETLTNNVRKHTSSSAHVFALISNMPVLYRVSCGTCRARAGCLSAGESWEQERQQVRGRRAFEMAGLSLRLRSTYLQQSQKGILNVPHAALLRNKNWFGSQRVSNMCKVGHVECMGYSASTQLPCAKPCCSHH